MWTEKLLQRAIGALCGAVALAAGVSAQAPATGEDKYIWLEDVSSARSMEWVNAENARAMKMFEADPHWKPFVDDAIKVNSTPDRIPMPMLRGDEIYNSWRDKNNPRGLLRKTTVADYLTAKPHWQPVIDFDALGKAENVSWVSHGLSCLYPGDDLCTVALSAGGEDANTEREFSLKQGKFVDGGFVLPHSKGGVSWIDKDTLLIERNWGADTMTKSGYPFVVKEWKRGTPLDSAKEVFRGEASDEVGSSGRVMHDAQGHHLVVLSRGVTFFERREYVQTPSGVKQLNIPAKAGLTGMLDGRVLIEIHEDWKPAGADRTFKQGSLLQVKLDDLLRDPANLKPTVVFEPTATEFLDNTATTKSRLLVTTLNNVQGRVYVYTPSGVSEWKKQPLSVPANITIDSATTNQTDDRFFISLAGFITPPSVWLGDASKGTLSEAKSQPALFDASDLTVEQLSCKGKDGTTVPYFVVHKKGMKYDGSNATLLNAYGGFEVSETPRYSAVTGKLWLERGGVYVLANIRGGGEFGPAWHEAGLKTHRQRIYDDFASVAEDLIARKITSTRHLGIEGGSNGGLLMGVEMTQHPDLWNAVVIDVPLLDMLRFEHIAAGASWVGEYGSTNVPEEQAFLAHISPYNQLKPGVKYPEPFIFTTTKDDRVGPQHARKFAAKMTEFHEPFYFYELTEGGHGSGASIEQEARTRAMTFVYLTKKLME